MENEPKDIVLVKLDKALSKLDNLHGELVQIKARVTAIEKQLLNMGEAANAQWDTLDRYEERLLKLES